MLRRVGHYRVQQVVGRGGLGVVYRATDDRTGRAVALKILHQPASDSVAARRLAREFNALSAIEHRNIVRVLDAGLHEDLPYLAMEFVDGLALRTWLEGPFDDPHVPRPPPPPADDSQSGSVSRPGGLPAWMLDGEPDSFVGCPRVKAASTGGAPMPVTVLPPAERARLNRPERVRRLRDATAQICDGLAFIHTRGLVHRDVKPSNVLVAQGGCAKLVDFGLVKLTASTGNTTATGHVVGTWRYMSPEQARGGRVDGRSDLYAVGGILYELLCGQPPFVQRQAPGLLRAIVSEPPPAPELLNPECDPALAAIAMRLLAKDPADRFQSADDAARRLRLAAARD